MAKEGSRYEVGPNEPPPPYFPSPNMPPTGPTSPIPNSNFIPSGPPPPYMHTHGDGSQPQQQVVFVTVPIPPLGPESIQLVCPHCQANILTSVRKEPGVKAWILGFLIAFVGCWYGCCLIPCCTDACLDSKHTCPNCEGFIGEHRS